MGQARPFNRPIVLHDDGPDVEKVWQTLVDALFIGAQTRPGSDLAKRLGCASDAGPLGPIVRTDADRMTSVGGIYAAGDVARAPHSTTWAASDGVTASMAVYRALVFG